ncbi:hypothetical protein [Rhodococcus sp. D-1]|uniref:hypothetical protein n=1 Tax=Rhodococcus sp. D-1 TaxID=1912238 RepID=UPI0009CFF10A|nr:hypothetical protein [Rhodococcus sp. D-1]OMQ31593.1 hypothetical protein BK799_21270 [Rhodococcus sp. D-1]
MPTPADMPQRIPIGDNITDPPDPYIADAEAIRKEIADSTGIPAHLIAGNTRHEIETNAAELKQWATPRWKRTPPSKEQRTSAARWRAVLEARNLPTLTIATLKQQP